MDTLIVTLFVERGSRFVRNDLATDIHEFSDEETYRRYTEALPRWLDRRPDPARPETLTAAPELPEEIPAGVTVEISSDPVAEIERMLPPIEDLPERRHADLYPLLPFAAADQRRRVRHSVRAASASGPFDWAAA